MHLRKIGIYFYLCFASEVVSGLEIKSASVTDCSQAYSLFSLRGNQSNIFDELKIRTSKLSSNHLEDISRDKLFQYEKLIEEENLIFSIAQPPSLREIVLADRDFTFQNTFQLNGKSNATAPISSRSEVESYRLGLSAEDYLKLSSSQKPVYGYLQFKKGVNESQTGYLKTDYGKDIWIFKTDKIIDRTSFSIGDSMSYKGYYRVMQSSKQPEKLTQIWNTSEDPHQYFLPFKENRDILIEHFHAEDTRVKSQFIPYSRRKNAAKPFYNFVDPWSSTKNPDELLNYIELQFFPDEKHQLGINQVKEFIFTEEPPGKDLYQMLRNKGIEVKDWRIQQEDPVSYIPHSEGGPSVEEVEKIKTAKAYLEKLKVKYYIKNLSSEQEMIVLKSSAISEKESRLRFLVDRGIAPSDAKRIIEADVPADLDINTNLSR